MKTVRTPGRVFFVIGSIVLATLSGPDRSAGQETARPEPPAAAVRVAIADLVMDPSPVERSGTAARFSVSVRSDYPSPVQSHRECARPGHRPKPDGHGTNRGQGR